MFKGITTGVKILFAVCVLLIAIILVMSVRSCNKSTSPPPVHNPTADIIKTKLDSALGIWAPQLKAKDLRYYDLRDKYDSILDLLKKKDRSIKVKGDSLNAVTSRFTAYKAAHDTAGMLMTCDDLKSQVIALLDALQGQQALSDSLELVHGAERQVADSSHAILVAENTLLRHAVDTLTSSYNKLDSIDNLRISKAEKKAKRKGVVEEVLGGIALVLALIVVIK